MLGWQGKEVLRRASVWEFAGREVDRRASVASGKLEAGKFPILVRHGCKPEIVNNEVS